MPETTERTTPRLLLDQRVTMRDGVELSVDVYLPPTGDGPWPAILQRTPYDNTAALWVNIACYFAQRGYVLRVTVASAAWPGTARNPNTNAPTGDDDEVRIATNTVHHTRAHPSRLLAPVVVRE